MSSCIDYASKLKNCQHRGKINLKNEPEEEPKIFQEKIKKLAEFITSSSHAVVHSGAGLSTSAGIPDFRGPTGIWTKEEELKSNFTTKKISSSQKTEVKQGKIQTQNNTPQEVKGFEEVRPTLSHMVILELLQKGLIKYIISQNIDGLHIRSGVQPTHISEIHGNVFLEECSKCRHRVYRDFQIGTVGYKKSKRICSQMSQNCIPCRGKFHDVLLDWDDHLPEPDLSNAEKNSSESDLAICMGTSLQMRPSTSFALRAQHLKKKELKKKSEKESETKEEQKSYSVPLLQEKSSKGKLVILNLSSTSFDKRADLVIHAPLDKIMRELSKVLNISIPSYIRTDSFQIIIENLSFHPSNKNQNVSRMLTICTKDEKSHPPCFIDSISVKIEDSSKKCQTITLSDPLSSEIFLDLKEEKGEEVQEEKNSNPLKRKRNNSSPTKMWSSIRYKSSRGEFKISIRIHLKKSFRDFSNDWYDFGEQSVNIDDEDKKEFIRNYSLQTQKVEFNSN